MREMKSSCITKSWQEYKNKTYVHVSLVASLASADIQKESN